jgi:hypothetical protein
MVANVKEIGTARGWCGNSPQTATDISLNDFYAYLPSHNYIFEPTGELWPAASLNSRFPPVDMGGKTPVSPSDWLDTTRSVEQMTWAPGQPKLIQNRLVADGGWIDRTGCATFNLYRPPAAKTGDAAMAGPWCAHIRHVYPDDASHIERWLAQRVQRPGEKINHALVLGGPQGIGKDSILEPVKYAIGPWNFAEVSPGQLLGRFNGFVKSVILRVSEARDLGDVDRYAFYDHSKTLTAAPPDVLRCDEKNLREHAVFNTTGVIITSNHKLDGIYLPADDRRHYVAWADITREAFAEDYWRTLYGWYAAGGKEHVVAYLQSLDLTGFDPKAPPPKTPAWHDIVDANRASEDGELADTLDELQNPNAVTLEDLAIYASEAFREWLRDRRNRRQIPHRMEAAGYVPVRSTTASDGLWKTAGKRQCIYARKTLSVRDRLEAATQRSRKP